MNKRHTLVIGVLALAACGQVVAPPRSASVTTGSAPVAQKQIFLDLSEKTFQGRQSQVFTTTRRWDLMYVFDCGVDEEARLNISINAPGQGLLGGDLVVDVASGGAAGVIEGLAPGSFSLVIDVGRCPWHIVAGSDLETERLLSLAPVASPSVRLKQNKTTDVEGVDDKQFPLQGSPDSDLLFAYDCGSAGDATFYLGLTDEFGLLQTKPPYHTTAASLVSTAKVAPRGWGVLRHLPILSRPGYVPPPGSLLLEVARAGFPEPQVACRKWHVIVGNPLELTRPLLPGF